MKYTAPLEYSGKEFQDFSYALMKKFNKKADVNAAGAYDAVQIMAKCIEQVLAKGDTLPGDNLRIEMDKIKDYHGATGITTFDENGDPIGKQFQKWVILNGIRTEYKK